MRSEPPFRLLIASQPMAEGVPQHVLDLLAAIDVDRYEVHVACPRGSTLWAGLVGRRGVALHAIHPGRQSGFRDLATLLRLFPLVRRADVVHAHSSKAGFLARLAAICQGRARRCVFTPHAWSFWAAAGLRRRTYSMLERIAAKWCRTILVVSEHERAAGLQAGIGVPDQYRVVLNGVDAARFSAEPRPQPGRILMVGRLSLQKRPDVAIEAFRIIRQRAPHAELHLVGQGPLLERLERQVTDLGLKGVRFLGFREDVPELLAEAACVVLASDYEACPLSLLEAMAAAVPVVATRVGGVPELIEHERTGLLVEPGNAADVAAAVCRLLEDPDRARQIGAAARVHTRSDFSVERMAEQIVAVYEEILGS